MGRVSGHVLKVSSSQPQKQLTLTLTLFYHQADWLGPHDVEAESTLLSD
jgi:hypothetical protein